MADRAYPLALDGAPLMPATTSAPNAAILFGTDGYDPASKGINGRRVAGESFLRGFFAHSGVDEFVSITHGNADHDVFTAMARASAVTAPLRRIYLRQPEQIAPLQVIHYPSPLNPVECWRRAPYGAAAWALCGITHTTATAAVMKNLYDLRAAPQMPWDAVICTSAAVQQSLRTLMELAEGFLADRFPGAVQPARPLLPLIPLGIHCDDFHPVPAAGKALRDRLGIGPTDVVSATIARLDPDEKFDPLPLFLAMEAAAPAIAANGGKPHYLLCGQFRDPVWRGIYSDAAKRLMPSVGFHMADGGDAAIRKATLSASDIFLFPIDNVQETFGLAPIEAMAAGLPLIVSDWDGMKDTVTPEVGIRVPTEMPGRGLATYLSQRHLGGTDAYVQYVGQLAALTRVDVAALARALVALGTDPALRRRMGKAGQARARALYDWRVVIPQIQALWAEQAAMLAHARKKGGPLVAPRRADGVPIGPAPEVMFRAYPSSPAPDILARRLRAVDLGPRPGVAETFALRGYGNRRRMIETPDRIEAVLAAHRAAGVSGLTLAEAAKATGLAGADTARMSLWLLKYHFLEEAS
jgi:glycosyltransferase involved in cell wall biosynthesis